MGGGGKGLLPCVGVVCGIVVVYRFFPPPPCGVGVVYSIVAVYIVYIVYTVYN